VHTNSSQTRSASITNVPIARMSGQPESLGFLDSDEVAIVINVDDESEETLVLTSTGILGWIYTVALQRVTG